MVVLADRLKEVQRQISQASSFHGVEEPKLIVVTKNHPARLPLELNKLGVSDFGENRVQEALQKSNEVGYQVSRALVNWHLIGQLQTNKVKQALEFAASIHSLDRHSLLLELAKRTAEREVPLEVFIQVNLTEDPGRGGVNPNEVLSFADQVVSIPNLNLAGLMAVASLGVEPQFEFERVARLGEKLRQFQPTAASLSIGMSSDFIQAIEFGATHLRIGSAITGNRPN
jgi:pyridoxal phosphate enzyme (YggS family)